MHTTMTTAGDGLQEAAAGLERTIADSKAISDWIAQTLSERPAVQKQQDVIAIAYLSMALEHREAILALVLLGARSSTMALLRATWEAVVRGLWASDLATDQDMKHLRARRDPPRLNSMVMQLQKKSAIGKLLGAIQRSHGKALDDYVHGGLRQLGRWIGPDGVAPRHSDAEMIEALNFVDAIGLLACAARESIGGREALPYLERLDAVLSGRRRSR